MSITICDVGPRDGLQNEPAILEPEGVLSHALDGQVFRAGAFEPVTD
jgi:hypothetical protein